MTLTQSYEEKRDLLIGQLYKRSNTSVASRAYAYDYDNIGNLETAQEAAESATSYESNQLNQYTAIGDFEPSYDDAGNQTRIKTETGIWEVIYNAENRPIRFASDDDTTVIECAYPYLGRQVHLNATRLFQNQLNVNTNG